MRRFAISLVLFAGACAVWAPVDAFPVRRIEFNHGPANCQPALPIFDGNIRKRPRAVANEGSSTAFVTCDIANLGFINAGTTDLVVNFNNVNSFAATVTCTFVNGFGTTIYSPFLVKSTTLQPQDNGGQLYIDGVTDNEGRTFAAPSVSCALPPGTEITGIIHGFFFDNGVPAN